MNLFQFVVNPDSFSQTVENLFHLSFLIKDGNASLQLDQNGLPIAAPSNPPDERDYSNGKAERKQCVMKFDWNMWEVNFFKISRSNINLLFKKRLLKKNIISINLSYLIENLLLLLLLQLRNKQKGKRLLQKKKMKKMKLQKKTKLKKKREKEAKEAKEIKQSHPNLFLFKFFFSSSWKNEI